MIFVLTNGDRVKVWRQNCGYEYKLHNGKWIRDWNIDPEEKIVNDSNGFFVIGKWGTLPNEPCDKKIPINHVMYLEESDEWEKPGSALSNKPAEFIEDEEMQI